MLAAPPRAIRPRSIKARAVPEFLTNPALQEYIRLFGKMTTLSVGFYCGLQYLHYKEIREKVDAEKNKSEDHKKKDER